MKILLLSDLHRELWREYAPVIDPTISHPDVVVLAGDIDTGARAVQWAANTFADLPVLYVHGNHEAYGMNLEDAQRDTEAACTLAPNVHFLHCGEFVLHDVRFLGATLWTDFALFGDDERQSAMHAANPVMVDYQRIRLAGKGYRKLRPTDTAQFHAAQRSWLQRKLDEPFAGKTVVITHMAPSLQSVAKEYMDDPVSAAFASRLEHLVEKADVWMHGHMHDTFDYRVGKCRVVCNPCGYMTKSGGTENARFDVNFVVDI